MRHDSLRPHRLQLAIPPVPTTNSEFAQVHVHGWLGLPYLKLHLFCLLGVCFLLKLTAGRGPEIGYINLGKSLLHGRWTGCISQGLIKIDQTKKKKKDTFPHVTGAVIGSGSR